MPEAGDDAEPPALDLSGLSLSSAVSQPTTQDRIALGEYYLRKDIAIKITSLFTTINMVVIGIIAALALLDQVNIARTAITPDQRIIDYRILAAVIAATTVQLGSVALIMAKYIFPTRADGA
mgnify:CR=1 FL=1